MGRKTKRRLSCFLCALLLFITGFETTAFTGVFAATARKIDVWDFGGVEESNTELYNNQITAADWDSCANVGTDGVFVKGTTEFGDLVLTHEAKDRLYSKSSKNYGTSTQATLAYDDYTANGMYYCNGTGGEKRRYITVNNVAAGDKIVVYMATQKDSETMVFQYLGEDGTQEETREFSSTGAKLEFVAQYSGSYKIYANTAAGGKPIFNRVKRIPGVQVTGTVDLNETGITGYKVSFTNDTTGVTTEAEISGNTFSVVLAAGDTYTATLSGATGYGFSSDTKKVATALTDVLNGKSGVKLTVEKKSVYTYSGKVTGFAEGYDVSNLKVTLTPPEDSLADNVVLSLGADYSFTAQLEPDVEYTAVLSGVNDYEVIEGGTVQDNQAHQSDIKVALKATHKVSGGFLGLEAGKTVSDLKFVNEEDGYAYAGTVTAAGYEVSLRDGAYAVSAVVEGYKTSTHVVVSGGEVSKDLLFVSTAGQVSMTRVPDIYVGYEDKGELNYNTVKEAVAACAAMNPTSEAERIMVHIAPGTYREQIIISTPYISFVNDSDKEVLLTWYYGIGYNYYSIDTTGYYNAENAYDQYKKAAASKWGCSTYVKNTATGFRADGITFEASFNRYITDEEIEDGVEATGALPQRRYGTDVTSKAATERATALAIEANQVELTNCAFLGSQDTLYTGNSATSIYFKNCRVEGNTDYIFGDGNCVFDGCELKWYGYSTGSVGGYLTAHKPSANTKYGYLFRNCTITANDDLTVTAGDFGRPWGADAQVTFLNTKVAGDLLLSRGWTDMSGNTPANAKFHEYNTTYTDGTAADVSDRVTGVMTEEEAAKVDVTAYFGGWTPASYVKEDLSVAFKTAPYVVDNGDINAPYPGHRLTVGYSLGENNDQNDASVIRWYLVSDDGTETLVKSSTANADKTYQITADAVGKHVKVVVVPQTFSGVTGTEMSYQVEAFVREGYEDPSAGNSDITLGDGVNIFLAGDSTVKDYSAAGMYQNGKIRIEGAWGEFLQTFFDESKVKIQNYANGGRSTRNFINEGSLDKIKENIGEGDYLFIQFGHNDCSNGTGYLEDRYVPLGEPDANGIYPSTAGTKVATPSSLVANYGDTFYSYDCGGTYKWYLQQYIDAAREAGATPVLVTPVSRRKYNSDGTIKPHHDSTDKTTGTQVTSNNAYVTAVRQLAEEQDVLLIDAFEMTKTLFEEAYKADPNASKDKSEYSDQIMAEGDGTHNNKLGGFLSAALIAQTIQGMDLNISKVVAMPSKIAGENPDGQQVFTVNGKNELKAYIKDEAGNYTVISEYWTTYGQSLITEIGEKHEALNPVVPDEPDDPVKPDDPDDPNKPDDPDDPNKPDDPAKTGVVIGEDGSILYYENGVASTAFTGMATDEATGKRYWFDAGVAARNKEALDPETNSWYWFDADGTMATDKDVNIPDGTENGKWVRYDKNGAMVKGEDYRYGGWYYFDVITGAMVKGFVNIPDGTGEGKWVYYDAITGQMHHGVSCIDGGWYRFDNGTGKMIHGEYIDEEGFWYYDDITGIGVNMAWQEVNGIKYWYENGKRQGTEGRGKEIYDPATNAWYWLDAVDNGKIAVSKDVYQESWAGQYADREDGTGKWVRYDENGHMVKGWNQQNGNTYYFDLVTGAMAKGKTEIDGVEYIFDWNTGILQQ